MNISIEPVNNGWLVKDRTNKKCNVFSDREKMMEHLNNIIPETNEQKDFIDAIDAVDAIEDKEHIDERAAAIIDKLVSNL